MISQAGTPDPIGPSPIEQALIDYVCGASRAVTPGSDAYQACLEAKLLSMRADFGRDLGRLSAAERKTIDTVCNKVNATHGREGYVACLSDQLVALSIRRQRAHPAPPEGTPIPSPSVIATAAVPPAPVGQSFSRSPGLWVGVTLAIVLVAAGGVLLTVKGRRASTKCRVCGAIVPDRGDLCQKCRHEAAEVLRRAAAERADEHRTKEDVQRRQRELAEKQRQENTRQEEEARVRHEEDARQREALASQRLVEEASLREGDAPSASVGPDDLFDPYVVLGVSRDASKEDILAAYLQAKSKYNPDQVAHLSNELQDHYKEKSQAVEQAYRLLTE